MWQCLNCCCRIRVLVCAVTFLAAVNHIFITNCFTLTLTQMTVADDRRSIDSGSEREVSRSLQELMVHAKEQCPLRNASHGNQQPNALPDVFGSHGRRFVWDSETKGIILSAFFAGFVQNSIPAAVLSVFVIDFDWLCIFFSR